MSITEKGNGQLEVPLCVSLPKELLHDTQAPVLTQVPQPGLVANVGTLEGHLHRTGQECGSGIGQCNIPNNDCEISRYFIEPSGNQFLCLFECINNAINMAA